MIPSAREIAEQATLESFVNCYLREIDPGTFGRRPVEPGVPVDCIELALSSQQAALRLELVSASRCGPHRFGRAVLRRGAEAVWRPVAPLDALTALLREAYGRFGEDKAKRLRGAELELLGRALDSYQSIAANIEARASAPAPDDDFLAAERSLTFGHWLHPTPKSLQGMASWQRPAYAPEHQGSFRLAFFAAKSSIVRHDGAGAVAPDIARALLAAGPDAPALADDEIAAPMHPLQAEALLLDPQVLALEEAGLLRRLGPAGPAFAATSSVRTVYSPGEPWMLKFSLPVRITNSVRVNRRHELAAGVAMARLFQRSGWLRTRPRFRIIQDPAWMTLDLPGRSESGFEVIFRQNPFMAGRDRGVATIAALTAAPLPGERSRLETLVRRVAADRRLRPAQAASVWFEAYLDCALEPPIELYDALGVALEAHQQNVVLDVSQGLPTVCHYRDSQGFYLSEAYRASLDRVAPEAAHISGLYYDDAEIQRRFGYYLIVNQVFSVISRMGHDGLAREDDLLEALGRRLDELSRRLTGAGRAFALDALERPTITSKANLVTRLLDIDELETRDEQAVYAHMPNPLFERAAEARRGEGHAVAV
ncbi:IucA/IucC family protein [Methylopila turkensis]|uniref:Petrobactin biosynthesis protein AsbA n=1 Tax=Methylopila turkensis TaxID=1437816 RepID=A0A9W6N7E4_9HYPH|nr:IucA/IucC family protein [Methylopila turkensis]GLK80322.1 petrobactin biosynthesis protein AsbA [Methylopila turkensis]